ncbi:MAG: hypothetical protein COT74_11695 [Bdellovibrionales bacterium CG10_big_fil_rev_8_21_14_0_10_45_34]|nr:MAG: hypothetical protein COT74_11695 [Bdellovibrionales bacterium CG10_big_fil_rev_8_21_14_0_10_45_34]
MGIDRATNEQKWHSLITKQLGSGMSVADFCSEQRISKTNFYIWRSRLVGKRSSSADVPVFTRAVVSSESLTCEPAANRRALPHQISANARWVAEFLYHFLGARDEVSK